MLLVSPLSLISFLLYSLSLSLYDFIFWGGLMLLCLWLLSNHLVPNIFLTCYKVKELFGANVLRSLLVTSSVAPYSCCMHRVTFRDKVKTKLNPKSHKPKQTTNFEAFKVLWGLLLRG